jgi:ribosome-associated translation inhibitor RaiA
MTKSAQLVGFERFSDDVKDKVNVVTKRLIGKYDRIFGEKTLKVFRLAIDKVRERKSHTLFELKGYLETTHGLFYTSQSDWKVLDAVDRVIRELERQLIEKKEKLLKEKEGRSP